jgi:predicted small lipoprotein YifL
MRGRTRHILWIMIIMLGAGSLLSACGQKGDLYRPDQDPQQHEKKKKYP